MNKTQTNPLKTLVRRKAIRTACSSKQNEIHGMMPDKKSTSEALEQRTIGSYPEVEELDLDPAMKT